MGDLLIMTILTTDIDSMEYASDSAAQAGYVSNEVMPNPIIHYCMNDNSLNTTVIDSMGNINGIAYRNTSLMSTTGKIGNGLSFNGTSDFISLGSSVLNYTNLSICFWLLVKAGNTTQYIFDRGPSADVWGDLGIVCVSGYLYLSCNRAGGKRVIANSSVSNGDHFVFLLKSDGTAQVYRNSSLITPVDTLSGFGAWNNNITDSFSIGRAGGLNAYYFSGALDDVRIYDSIISQTTISSIYNDGNGTEDDFYNSYFQTYSEPSILQSGLYSLKCIASQTTSLNKALTRTITSPLNLFNKTNFTGYIYSNRTGSNIKISLHDSAVNTLIDITPNITSQDTWQAFDLDISTLNRSVIDKIIITIVNADAENTFYLDNFQAIGETPIVITTDNIIYNQGSYSLKTTASQDISLNKTVTKYFTTPLDLSNKTNFIGYVRSNRVGSNFKLSLKNSGYNTSKIGIATADSSYVSEDGYLPFSAIDQTTTARWQSLNTTFPHWWKYDYLSGREQIVTSISICKFYDGGNSALKNFTFLGSNDDITYDLLYTGIAANAGVDKTWESFSFANTTAYRYYKINITDSYRSDNWCIFWEIKFNNDYVDNVVTADSCYSILTHNPKFACNNDTTNVWQSANTAFPHWWQYDLGVNNSAVITSIDICKWNGDTQAIKDFYLSGSNDNSNWTIIGYGCAMSSVDKTWENFKFTNSTAYRYHRVTFTSTYRGDGYLLFYEIKLNVSSTNYIDIAPNISSADTWQLVEQNLTSITNNQKEIITEFIITILNADSETIINLDKIIIASDIAVVVSKIVAYEVLTVPGDIAVSKMVAYEVLTVPGDIAVSKMVAYEVLQEILPIKIYKSLGYVVVENTVQFTSSKPIMFFF